MFSVLKQSHPPTGIEHAIYCNFFSFSVKSLITVSVNHLNVYRFNEVTQEENVSSMSIFPLANRKFECLASYSLFGNVTDLKSVRLPGMQRDVILLSFLDAKLSAIMYDPATHDLATLSLHYFEDEKAKDGLADNLSVPVIRIDPDNRCAVMLISGNKLVVLPFRRDIVTEDSTNLSPITSSYIIELNKMNERIDNIIDIQFLYGYHEPTVFILFEPQPTTFGRVAMRKDTCHIVAVSLNIPDKVNPVIWFLEGLPFDCYQVLAIPKPIGGVVVFAVNSLIYLNQSIPPYAVSLNSIADVSTSFPLRSQSDVKIALDAAQVCLIAFDKLVVSLKGGELYVITLVIDSMRSVRSFHFDKTASSIYTTCLIQCDPGYLFLGSRLGNSLLIKYLQAEVKLDSSEPAAKKKKEDAPYLDNSQMDIDAIEVYGAVETQAGTQVAAFSFHVCDSLLNIGPCGNASVGETSLLSEELVSENKYDLEIVTTSGYGKGGSLTVLQQSIRPQIVTTFNLPDFVNMWTVYGTKTSDQVTRSSEETASEPLEDETMHSYLILSRSSTTMILQTGQEITELEQSGFSTQSTTVYAGNMGEKNKYILQVSSILSPKDLLGVRLLQGLDQLQHIPLDIGSKLKRCTVADPYIFLLSENGLLMTLTLKSDATLVDGKCFDISKSPLTTSEKIVDICLYKDESGLFTSVSNQPSELMEVTKPVLDRSFSMDTSAADDEDELLYGDSDASFTSPNVTMDVKPTESSSNQMPKTTRATYWCFVLCESGSVEIYSLPEYKMVYYMKNIAQAPSVITDSKAPLTVKQKVENSSEDLCRELTVIGLGYKKSRPHMMFFHDLDLYIYEVYPFYGNVAEDHLKIRFKKINHGMLLRERKNVKMRRKAPEAGRVSPQKSTIISSLRIFDNIGGYSGVFVTGLLPYWIIMTSHGVLRYHCMVIDGPIRCLTEFNNVNCPRGFLYFNNQDEMRICTLPSHMIYDAPWPTRKITLRRTCHYVSYHKDSRLYAVITSTPEPCNKYPHAAGDEKEIEELERDDRFIYPNIDLFKLELFSPSDWELIPNVQQKFEEFENVTCMKTVNLKYEGSVSGMKGYMAVGIATCHTDEVYARGRIVLLDIVEVVPEPGQPSGYKMKVVANSDQRSPVTAICSTNGLLVGAVGQKIYIWQMDDKYLTAVSFIDTFIYIHSLMSIKNLILAADIVKSVLLYRYQEDQRVISLVSRDTNALEIYAIDYFVDNQQLSFLVTDRHKNILIYSYNPENRESQGGKYLLRRADINAGSHINSFFRIQCRYNDPSFDKKTIATLEKRHTSYYMTLDGSFGYILPLSEKVYRRLLMVQNILMIQLPYTAGLNPKAYRSMVTTASDLTNRQHNILDGELLWKFLSLGTSEQKELARRIGITTDIVMNDLLEIDRCTLHF